MCVSVCVSVCGRENSSAVHGGNRCESTGVCRRGFVSRILTHAQQPHAKHDSQVGPHEIQQKKKSSPPHLALTLVTLVGAPWPGRCGTAQATCPSCFAVTASWTTACESFGRALAGAASAPSSAQPPAPPCKQALRERLAAAEQSNKDLVACAESTKQAQRIYSAKNFTTKAGRTKKLPCKEKNRRTEGLGRLDTRRQ